MRAVLGTTGAPLNVAQKQKQKYRSHVLPSVVHILKWKQ